MGKLGVNDINAMKETIAKSSSHGFLSFLLTMLQYGLITALGFMIFDNKEAICMLGGNVSSYFLVMLIVLIGVYLITTYNSKYDQSTIINSYVQKQEAAKMEEKKKHDDLVKYRISIGPEIKNTLKDVLINLNAGRVTVCEMHNGTKNLSGLPFIYADMAYEVEAPECDFISDEYKNFSMAKYPFVGFHYDDGIVLCSVDELSKEDPRLGMKLTLGNSAYFAGMVVNGIHNPLGFLIVTFPSTDDLPTKSEIISEMTKASQIISSLLDK